MWTEPQVVVVIVLAMMAMVGVKRPVGARWRWPVAAVIVITTAVTVVLVRRELREHHSLAEEGRLHCKHIALKLSQVASAATVDGPDSVLTEQARKEIEWPTAGWIIADLDFCVGWRRREACQHALFEAMKLSDPMDFAAAVKDVARSVEQGGACDGAE